MVVGGLLVVGGWGWVEGGESGVSVFGGLGEEDGGSGLVGGGEGWRLSAHWFITNFN